ncbi:MAG: hypothetical protein ACRBFS_12105 [Aureispira sp.]
MALTEKQEETIEEINYLTYEQYQAGWCKVALINGLENYGEDKDIVKRFLKEPSSLTACQEVMSMYLEDNISYVTPESFCYRYRLLNATWQLSEEGEHLAIINDIIEHSFFHIQRQIEKKEAERKEWFSHWGLKDISAYENAPQEVQKEVNLPKFYENYGFTPEGGPWLEFTEYKLLKRYFLEDLFHQDTVQFFVNMPPSKVSAVFESEENIPAVIGIDADKIGLFWFNY